jgi:spore coat protein H
MLRLSLIASLVCALCVHAADRSRAGEELFTNNLIREVRLTIREEGIRELRRDTREYVRATIKEGQTVYTNVGVHLKGSGSFRPIDQKPAFTVKFNKFVEDQNFYGLTKISLNNAVQDPSYIREMLCTELFREAGVPVARVTHARVFLNDRYLGLYTLLEGLNKPFLHRNFKDRKGNLYEGHTRDITEYLDQDNGEDTSQKDLKALMEAVNAPTAQRWSKLSALVDMEKFISMLGAEVLMAHWDGYWLNRNNYCIYNDPGTRLMTFIPHGLDNMFQLAGMSWRPTMQGILVRATLHTPEGQRAYRERLPQLLTNHFNVETLTKRVDAIAAHIRPTLEADGTNTLKEFDASVADLKRGISERIKNVSRQISALGAFAKFDASGIASLRGTWTTNVDAGIVIMTQGTEDKRPVLKIKHGDTTGTIASWRTRVALEGGRYRFRGKVKTQGLLPPDSPNVGVSLRVSGIHPPFQVVGDTDWKMIEFDFEVLPPSDDVELVCHFSTVLGEVWFDASSLQLVRLGRSVVEVRNPVK